MKNLSAQMPGKTLLFLFFLFLTLNVTAQVTTTETSLVTTANDETLVWGPCPEFMPEGCDVTILHGDPAAGEVDILFRLQPNTKVPYHWHTSAERMILVSGELQVSYEGEEMRTLKAGDYAFGPAKKPHTARCGEGEPCVLFIAFNEPLDHLRWRGNKELFGTLFL